MKYYYCFTVSLLLLWSLYEKLPTGNSSDEAEIVQVLRNETQYFCERDLEEWALQWSHGEFVSKMYAGNTEFKAFTNWEAILQNTADHLAAHPAPIDVPVTNHDYQIQVFEETALVTYTSAGVTVPTAEYRLMVKEAGDWKIARMETIYLNAN